MGLNFSSPLQSLQVRCFTESLNKCVKQRDKNEILFTEKTLLPFWMSYIKGFNSGIENKNKKTSYAHRGHISNLFILFIYLWLRWVFVAVRGLSLVAASGGYSSLQCAGFSLRRPLLLRSTGSRLTGFSSCGMQASVVVARGL